MAKAPTPQLETFIARFAPEVAACARACLAKMQRRFKGANVLVYDNYNALALGFCGSERASEIVFSLAVYPRWVSLFLMHGPKLEDPKKLLQGGGTTVRHIVLEGPKTLDDVDVTRLIDQAHALSKVPMPSKGKGAVIIKSISAKQRPRRPGAKG
jgi:hypothetical protein